MKIELEKNRIIVYDKTFKNIRNRRELPQPNKGHLQKPFT